MTINSRVAMPPDPPQRPGDSAEQFIPDLCRPPVLLLLIVVAELLALALVLAAAGLHPFNWEMLGLVSFQIQCVAVLSAGLLCALRPQLGRWPDIYAGSVCYLLVLLLSALISLAGQWLLQGFWQPLQPDWWLLGRDLVITAIIAGVALRYMYLQQQLRNQQEAELRARVQALQSRIRPHFLFNSLNSIASLIGSDPNTAERLVEDLAELFRASLAEPALVPLETELALCRHYMDIEQLRLGRRLQVDWHLDIGDQSPTMPSMLLQPLLENAIFHGIEPRAEGGKVDIAITVRDGWLTAVIRNPVPAEKAPGKNGGNHMALDNIRHRLTAHYGPSARLSSRREGAIFITEITYPAG